MAVVSDNFGVALRGRADDTIFQVDALVTPSDVCRTGGDNWREVVHVEELVVVIRMVAIMTIVQNHVCKILRAPILDIQALVGIACPPDLARATRRGNLVEDESLILWILARPDLDLVKVLATATCNIHA